MSLTESTHGAEFLLSYANGDLSFENVTVTLAGTGMKAGQLLSKITASGKYVAYNDAASDGTQAVAAVLAIDLQAFTGDVKARVVARLAEVDGSKLVGRDGSGHDTGDLAALFIAVR